MFRPELKEPKNAAGAILVFLSVVTTAITYEYSLPFEVYYAAAAMYFIGMILLLIPGRAADPDQDHKEEEK